MAAFYRAACDARVLRKDEDSVWLDVGGVTVIFREVPDYVPPTWPSPAVPMQAHLDFSVADLAQAERELRRHGATTPEHQPHRGDGLLVMLDPAGHPFCIARSRQG